MAIFILTDLCVIIETTVVMRASTHFVKFARSIEFILNSETVASKTFASIEYFLYCTPLLVDDKTSLSPGIHLGVVIMSLSSFIRIYSVNEM